VELEGILRARLYKYAGYRMSMPTPNGELEAVRKTYRPGRLEQKRHRQGKKKK